MPGQRRCAPGRIAACSLRSLAFGAFKPSGLGGARQRDGLPSHKRQTPMARFAWAIGVWRSGRDSNPRYPFEVYSLSRGALSTTQPPLRANGRRATRKHGPGGSSSAGMEKICGLLGISEWGSSDPTKEKACRETHTGRPHECLVRRIPRPFGETRADLGWANDTPLLLANGDFSTKKCENANFFGRVGNAKAPIFLNSFLLCVASQWIAIVCVTTDHLR